MPANELAVLEQQFQPLAPHFAQVLGTRMAPERLIRTVLISCERTPKLLECTRESLVSAAMSAAVLGLEVDGVSGQAFLIPFKDTKLNRTRAQLVIGYKGYNTIAARDAHMTITGEAVHEGDEFDYEFGTRAFVRHKPSLEPKTARPVIAAWAKAEAFDRPPIQVVMSIFEIEAIRERAPGGKRSDSPWNDPLIGFPAMASKTPKRRLARSLPMGLFQLAARMEEAHEEQGKHAYIAADKTVMIEGTPASASPAAPEAQVLPKATPVAPAREQLTQVRSSMSFEDYSEFLDTLIADATSSDELGNAFDSHTATHGKFTNDEYDQLRERVMKRMDELDRARRAQ